ncbi:gamma-parvin isoform X1 [Anolis carolinensis]|uniref:gamma-parvin isoform X1 n=1 Tax=Anolis carolinensis TaxID=28377 RepID=UPI002F2B3721
MEQGFLKVSPEFVAIHQLPPEDDIVLGEKRKYINPSSRNDPKLEALHTVLLEWINTTLQHEHIVVRSLEQDLYDGLVLHHLLEKLGSLTLKAEKLALTEMKQRLKLATILETVSTCLKLEESELKWSVDAILKKDLLSTLHLLVALAEHFKPSLALPPNVKVDIIITERTSNGLKTENGVEFITKDRECEENSSKAEIFDDLLKNAPEKLDAVKEVLLKFVNKHVEKLGLTVKDINAQFADGVILILLIGQLQGYFLNLGEFFLNPTSVSEKMHNVNLAVELLMDEGLLDTPINLEAATDCHCGASVGRSVIASPSLFGNLEMAGLQDRGLHRCGEPRYKCHIAALILLVFQIQDQRKIKNENQKTDLKLSFATEWSDFQCQPLFESLQLYKLDINILSMHCDVDVFWG